MKRLHRCIQHFLSSPLTWRAAWRVAAKPQAVAGSRFHVVKKDGFLYIEPRVTQ